jgi:hypothetical protein
MDTLERLLAEIERLRASMCELISKDTMLLNPKILVISQELDNKINEYNELLKKKE